MGGGDGMGHKPSQKLHASGAILMLSVLVWKMIKQRSYFTPRQQKTLQILRGTKRMSMYRPRRILLKLGVGRNWYNLPKQVGRPCRQNNLIPTPWQCLRHSRYAL